MHANFIRLGGVAQDLPNELARDIYNFVVSYQSRIREVAYLLNANRIWRERVVNVGCVALNQALE